MTDSAPDPNVSAPEPRPLSLRDESMPPAPPLPEPPRSGSQGMITFAAAVIVFAGLIIAAMLVRDDGLSDDELRSAVNEAVGTQVGAFGLAPSDPETGRASLQD